MAPPVVDSQFWNQDTQSAASVHGEVRSLPFEPPPLGLLRGSRLIRSQQLLLLQDYASFPFTPSFSDGSFSLDRVILSAGGPNWWTTVTQRVQTNAVLNFLREKYEGNDPMPHVSDGWEKVKRLFYQSMNALGMHTRAHVGSKTVFSVSCEVDDCINWLLSRNNLPEDSEYPSHVEASLLHRLGAHELRLRAARNDKSVDRGGRYWNVPEMMSIDLSSYGLCGLGYRAGIYHSSGANCTSKVEGDLACPTGAAAGTCGRAALFLEKDINIWKGVLKKPQPFNLLDRLPHVTFSGIIGGIFTADTLKRGQQWNGLILRPTNPRVSLDAFASLNLSAQFGRFERWFLDFSRVNAQLHFGTSASFSSAYRYLHNGNQNDALPTMEVTLEQQVFGPLGARMDCRFGVDSRNGLQLQDVVYGLDFSPISSTSLKVVVWYAPSQNEGMMEFRFLEK